MDLFCVKCKKRTPTLDPTTVKKNNREAVTGKCEICGDIDSKLAKIPGAPWEKYPGEKTSFRI